ncbi:MAG: hypothetical protein KF852_18685 [Saprospiraceae bacterium]|nr:hypothetical protein [Saprospiraceae bacterium]
MTAAPSAFDEIARLVATGIEPEKLMAYEIPAYLTEQYIALVAKEKAGSLSIGEKNELDGLLMINHVISMAKLMAIKKLAAT